MASSYSRIQGITIQVGADTTDLVKALKAVDTELRTTQSALNDVNNLLKLDPKNTELLQQKQKLLGTAIADTKAKLEKEKEALAQLKQKDSTPEVVDQMERLERQIVADEQQLQKFEKEFQSFGSVGAQQVKQVGEELKKVGDKMASVGKTLTATVTAPIVAGFTVAAKTASDYEENINKLDVAFGDSAKSVRNFTDNAMKGFGLSKVAASEAASSFGAMAKGVGLTDDEAAKMAVTLVGLTADLGSYFNTSNDIAQTALEAVFTGNAQALKKFGVIMTDTNLKEFAADHGLLYDQLTNEEKVLLRYNYVLDKTKDASGDYARTSDGMANSVKTCQAALQDLATAIGTQLLPIVTPIIKEVTEFIKKFANLPAGTQKMIVKIGLLVAALGPVITVIGGLISGIGSILTLAPSIVSAMGTIIPIIGKVGAAVGGLLAAISPTTLIIAAIIAAVIALTVVVVKNWDTIKAATTKAWESVKQVTQRVWNGITTYISNALRNQVSVVTTAFNNMTDRIRNRLDRVRNIAQTVVDAVTRIFRGAHWELPRIKLPHFSVSEGKTILGITLPKVSVEWYRKAYENPYLFTSPTVVNGRGFGDGGGSGELVYGRDALMRDIAQVSQGNITVNVYAAEGMDVNQLADKIQNRLAQVQRQRMMAYA